jgi:hypothetical protein
MARGRENLRADGIVLPELSSEKDLQDWQQAEDLYVTIGQNIVRMGHGVNDSVQIIKMAGMGGDPELQLAVSTIARDLQEFTEGLVKIHERHKTLTGKVSDPNLLTLYLSVGTDYTLLAEQLKGTTFNNLLTVEEHMNRAVARLQAADAEKQLSPEQDPGVITDVEVKEPSTEQQQ